MELREAWDRQWRGSSLSTLAENLEPAVLSVLDEGWRRFFSHLPSEASLLDVGTGNGYLALFALRCNKEFRIHGTDFSAINPQTAVPHLAEELKKIRFYPQIPLENLCFANETFDAVVGQHAIEYSDVQKSFIEVARVLKRGGQIRFLMHAENSVILEANVPKISQFEYVLDKVKIFELVEKTIMASLVNKDEKGELLFQAIEKVKQKFQQDSNTTDLLVLLKLLKNAFLCRKDFESPKNLRHWLQENEAEARAVLLRIESMKKSAWPEARLDHLKNLCLMAGCATVVIEKILTSRGDFLGWVLLGKKN